MFKVYAISMPETRPVIKNEANYIMSCCDS